MKNIEQIKIAGPCAVESKVQWEEIVTSIGDDIQIVRGGIFKPRTVPGWDGLGESALPWMFEIAHKHGKTPALEIMIPEHIDMVTNAIQDVGKGESLPVIVWIGSRNQNHIMQRSIATRLMDSPKEISVGIKNPPWADIKHTVGIVQHLCAAGLPQNRIAWIALRGFDPSLLDVIFDDFVGLNHDFQVDGEKVRGLRNIPPSSRWIGKLKDALVRAELDIPLIVDPSHIAGDAHRVPETLVHMLSLNRLQGFIVEVNSIENPLTDRGQQLSIPEFQNMMSMLQNRDLLW